MLVFEMAKQVELSIRCVVKRLPRMSILSECWGKILRVKIKFSEGFVNSYGAFYWK